MESQLQNIEKKIEEYRDLSLEEKRSMLEPLFNEVYQLIKNSDVEIPVLLRLSQLENQLSVRMIDACPKVEPSLDRNSKWYLLEQIVYYTRKKAQDNYNCNIREDSLRARSLEFSNLLLENAKSLQVPAILLDLKTYFQLPYSHYVVIAYALEEFYLLDCTYQQFFLLGYNFKNRYYEHPSYTRICEIGGRMLDNRKMSAVKLIQDGYLSINSLDFKNYCDAFAEYGNIDKKEDSISYLKDLLKPIERSSDKVDRILVSKMQYL